MMTHTNHYRSFGERLPMVKFTITDDKSDTSHHHATKQIQESFYAHYRYTLHTPIYLPVTVMAAGVLTGRGLIAT